MNDNEFYTAVWKIIVTGLVLISLTIAGCDSYETKKYIENGYTQSMLPGSNTSHWIK